MASLVPSEKNPEYRIPVRLDEYPAPPKPLTRLQELVREIKQNKKTGIYNYVDSIKPQSILIYLVIIQMFIIVFSRFNFELRHLVGLILGVFIVVLLHEHQRTQYVDEMQFLEIKLESINPTPKYFYLDANIVEIVYDMLEFEQLASKNFKTMVMSIDNILQLHLDTEKGIPNCGRLYAVAHDNYENAMNAVMSMMISVPTDNIRLKKLKLARENLQVMLLRHLDFIKNRCNEQLDEKWNIHTSPINDIYRSLDFNSPNMNIQF